MLQITADGRTYTFTTDGAKPGQVLDTLGSLYNSRGEFHGIVVRNNRNGRHIVMRAGRTAPALDRAVHAHFTAAAR